MNHATRADRAKALLVFQKGLTATTSYARNATARE